MRASRDGTVGKRDDERWRRGQPASHLSVDMEAADRDGLELGVRMDVMLTYDEAAAGASEAPRRLRLVHGRLQLAVLEQHLSPLHRRTTEASCCSPIAVLSAEVARPAPEAITCTCSSARAHALELDQ